MLELTIVDGLSVDNPTEKTKYFDDKGGIIGRDLKSEWPLYDPSRVISSQHVKVIFSQGGYYFSDLSTNGVMTEKGQKLRKGEYRLLKVGDVYAVGPYQIEVTALNTSDETIPFKEAGLAHILKDSDSETEAMSPLQYVERQNDPLAEKANQDFPFKQKPNTLKAFDFMPEPIDLGNPASSQPAINAAIPDLDFLSVFENSSAQLNHEPDGIKAPITETSDSVLPQSVVESEMVVTENVQAPDFKTQFCDLFDLNQKHFDSIDATAFEKSIRSFFIALNERFQINLL